MASDRTPFFCLHLITEGPTDRILLSKLIKVMIADTPHKILRLSSTQRARCGKHSILFNYSILTKFLHHGFHRNVDLIIICVDNDEEEEKEGIGIKVKELISQLYEEFCRKNPYYSKIPCLVSVVPIKTIDYWIKAILLHHSECEKILKVLSIPKGKIKEETYGKEFVFRGIFIDSRAIDNVVEIIKPNSLEKLRCLPAFNDFENQLLECISRKE